MPAGIQPLPTEVVHLIAAGEVIDSLAAVVRELVENALDAQATRITIAIWPAQWQVRVTDNGMGISLEDLQQAATPHSTSKIRDRTDLWQINSLGFRGEALHSLAQLSELEICSRPLESGKSSASKTDLDAEIAVSDMGWQATYDCQGQPTQIETIALAPGTVVTAAHLFHRWPARRQSLPSPTQQLRTIQRTIQQMALCHPHITWQVEQNDKPWFSIWPGETAQEILPQILRDVSPSDLQEVAVAVEPFVEEEVEEELDEGQGSEVAEGDADASEASFSEEERDLQEDREGREAGPNQIQVTLGLPDRCHRRRPDWVVVALNGRPIHAPELEQTILNGFRRVLPRDRHPICFLHLQVTPDQIDWNRHPAKTDIYLRNLPYWQEQITQAIDRAFQLSPIDLSDIKVNQLFKVAEANGAYRHSRTISTPSPHEDSALAPPAPLLPSAPATTEQNSTPLKAIAQVHNMYILAEHPTGVWLIEQHIAHERVLYEELCDRWQLVPLESPLILEQLTNRQVEQLQRLGIEVDVFGEQLWAVRTVPAPLAKREDCSDAILELSLGGDLESALVATACRTAIRNGAPLSLAEMQTLITQWQQTRNPRTCPHGRPICLSLEESSLSRFFRRHWVIGKSHGI